MSCSNCKDGPKDCNFCGQSFSPDVLAEKRQTEIEGLQELIAVLERKGDHGCYGEHCENCGG